MADEPIYKEIGTDDFTKQNLSYFPYEKIEAKLDKDGNKKDLTEGEKEINTLRKERSERDAEEAWGKSDASLKESYPDSTVGARQAFYNALKTQDMETLLALSKHKELVGEGKKPDEPAPVTDASLTSVVDRWKQEGVTGEFKETLDGFAV